MNLASIRAGDIVAVRKRSGHEFLASVTDKAPGELEIKPICRNVTYTSARAREVTDHWSKRGRPRTTPPAA